MYLDFNNDLHAFVTLFMWTYRKTMIAPVKINVIMFLSLRSVEQLNDYRFDDGTQIKVHVCVVLHK